MLTFVPQTRGGISLPDYHAQELECLPPYQRRYKPYIHSRGQDQGAFVRVSLAL